MLDRLKALKEQMGCTFWVALALIAVVLILIALGIGRLVWTLVGGVTPEVAPAGPTPAGVVESRPTGVVESRPMEAPSGVTVVGVDPAWQRIGPGGTTEVAIRIESVPRLYGAEVHLTFDPNYLEIQDADPDRSGVQLQTGSFPAPDFVVQNQADNVQGTIDYAVSQLAPREPVDGGGVLATITVKTKGEGTSRLAFTGAKLANPDGQQIPAEILDGEVVVAVGALSVQPTATEAGPEITPTVEGPPTETAVVIATPLPTQVPTAVPGVPTAVPSPTETPLSAPAEPTMAPSPTPVQVEPIATPPPPVVTEGCYYVVRRGDTLFSIARRFGTTIGAIAQANGLSNPRYIRAGQRLIIPGACPAYAPPPAVSGATVYIVRPGDTLYSIARRYHTTVTAIAWANGIANPHRIWVGQRLVIPTSYW
ncbi:MAG: LysM peptidoglycan-binding domain-containing protein [Anaerolineales bacterium]|nr:MAG: LysM peptidoglycan-binding domain-containing protein [Anaerolineales bacterium]